jgi:hypothetical protein
VTLRDQGVDGRIVILKWSTKKWNVQTQAEKDFCETLMNIGNLIKDTRIIMIVIKQ